MLTWLFVLLLQLFESMRVNEYNDIVSVVDHRILLGSIRWGGTGAWCSKAVLVCHLQHLLQTRISTSS
jgi:hypothetical protein